MVPNSSIFRGVLSIVEKEIIEMFSAWGGEQEKSFDQGQGIFFS